MAKHIPIDKKPAFNFGVFKYDEHTHDAKKCPVCREGSRLIKTRKDNAVNNAMLNRISGRAAKTRSSIKVLLNKAARIEVLV